MQELKADMGKLKAAREALNLSLREASKLSGVHHTTIWQLENGRRGQSARMFPAHSMTLLAKAYNKQGVWELCVDAPAMSSTRARRQTAKA